MMKLSTMKKILDTVDTDWRSPLAEHITERWDYDPKSVYCIRVSSNAVFIFTMNGKKHFLRFNDSCEREYSEVESEIDILLHLRDKPVPTAQPVRSKDGKYIEAVETDTATYYAVVFEALTGEELDVEELSTQQAKAWGRTLGKLHQCFKEMPEQLHMLRPSWEDQLHDAKSMIPEHETDTLKAWKAAARWVEQIPVTPATHGVIHYDFDLDNLRWDEGSFSVFDFDDSANYAYAADIAHTLSDFAEDGLVIDMNHPTVQQFIQGYQQETDLNPAEIGQLDGYLYLHKIISFAGLLRALDIEETAEDQQWLIQLRNKLTKYVERDRSHFARTEAYDKI